MRTVCLSSLTVMTLLGAALAAEPAKTGVVASAQAAPETAQVSPPAAPAPQAPRHGFGHKLLLYIPNRLFDALDIVRARVRLGPGFSLDFRVTKYTEIFLGSYASAYFGLTGPRQTPRVPWPAGLESRSGMAASVLDTTTVTSPEADPRYSFTEIGAGAQLVLAGAEVGVDPAEVFDLILGVLFVDFRNDDL